MRLQPSLRVVARQFGSTPPNLGRRVFSGKMSFYIVLAMGSEQLLTIKNLACNSCHAPAFFTVARRDRTGTAVYEGIRWLAIFSATIY
jgi:hypothetical protein